VYAVSERLCGGLGFLVLFGYLDFIYALGLLILFSFITRNLSNGRLTSEPVGPLTGRFVVHNVSKLVHYSDPSFVNGRGARMISCGRSLNQNYKYITQFDSVDVCKRCKSNAVKDGALPKALAQGEKVARQGHYRVQAAWQLGCLW
jgi:hypothetical protein